MTALALKLDSATDPFRQDFARSARDFPGAGLAWLDKRRAAAMDAFAATGVPGRRVEAWKFTDLASMLEDDLKPAEAVSGTFADAPVFAVAGARVVLIHGRVRDITAADGVEIVDLGRLDAKTPDWVAAHLGLLASGADQPMGAASLALMRGGVAVRVKKSGVLNLDFLNPALSKDAVSHTRILILVEEGAALKLLQSHSGAGTAQNFANLGIELVLKAGAKLDHVLLQAEAASAIHVASIGATLARDAHYIGLYTAAGARLSRLDVNVRLDGPGAHARINNVAVPGSGLADTTTVMDHATPHTTSRQLFKSVVGDRGRSVSQGRVLVREGAMKSDSHQLFKALLLSPRAEADAKPELEIFADDVICGHGTAIGALDDDALFYLRARGIPEDEARGLLVRAFLEDAMDGIAGEEVHDALWRHLDVALAPREDALA